MARPPRVLVPGGLYHVTARGNRKQLIFRDDRDCEWFLAIARDVAAKRSWQFHGYCLMPNHYHLLVETPKADLSLGMQRVNSRYAQAFNHRHATSGHLFQGRFHAVLVTGDSHLLELSRYLALNPVRAGLCDGPGEWRWSSYRTILGSASQELAVLRERVLEQFHRDPERAKLIFRAFVHEPLVQPA
jgi:putative transposase